MAQKIYGWRAWLVLGIVAILALPVIAGDGEGIDPGQLVRVGPVGLREIVLVPIYYGDRLVVRPVGEHQDVEIEWEYDLGTTITVIVDPGVANANSIYFSNVFQLQIYLNLPEHNLVIYRSARETRIVTPDFELLEEFVWTSIMCDDDIIQFHIPYYSDEMEVFVSLTWDPERQQTYTTPVEGLFYIDNQIAGLGSRGQCQQGEIFRGQQWGQTSQQWGQVQESGFKCWPARPGEADADGLYIGWPKQYGSTTYWEYDASSGFAKKVHVDLNGNGVPDPGEPYGYIGRCPYSGGINTQVMGDGQAEWISRYNGYNERMRYVFDGQQVTSTKEIYNPTTGQWEEVPGSEIVGGPYTNPTDVPGP